MAAGYFFDDDPFGGDYVYGGFVDSDEDEDVPAGWWYDHTSPPDLDTPPEVNFDQLRSLLQTVRMPAGLQRKEEDSGEEDSSGESGGYDCHFISEVPNSLQCLICTLPARRAHQVDCCGKVFCKSCLSKLKKAEHRACPNCREKKWKSFPDKKSVRDIESLRVKCPNKEGGCSWEGELREMNTHVVKCTTEMVACKYSSIGCKAKVLKKNLPSHEEACTTQHLKMAMERIESLTKRLTALELHANPIAATPATPPVTFKMCGYMQHRTRKTLWESPPFFSHLHGYKMYLQVNCFNFDGRGNNSISVKACLMSGTHDDSLVWPFKGVVTFHLLNQEADIGHKTGKARFLERRLTEKNRRVSPAQGRSKVGWGVSDLLVLNRDQDFWSFVVEDCLYLRVSEVEVAAANKPWLL